MAYPKSALTWEPSQLMGAASYTGTVIMFVSATKLTTAANAILLQYTCPIYVALLGAWLLKEKTTRKDWLTIGVVFGGMALFFLDKMSAGGIAGNLLAMASGFTMALMAIFMRRQKAGDPMGSVLLGNMLTFLIGLPFMFAGFPSWSGVLGLTLMGTFQLGLSYICYSIAIKQVKALEASIITMIEPILNPVWVFLLLGETPGPWALVGGAVIVAALVGRYVFADDPPNS
jgi:drug/metabolite transporter (DMT)-like permease